MLPTYFYLFTQRLPHDLPFHTSLHCITICYWSYQHSMSFHRMVHIFGRKPNKMDSWAYKIHTLSSTFIRICTAYNDLLQVVKPAIILKFGINSPHLKHKEYWEERSVWSLYWFCIAREGVQTCKITNSQNWKTI